MSTTPVTPAKTVYCGKEQITSLSTVKSLAAPSNASWAILVPESQAIRLSLAGGTPGTPTTADMLIEVGQPVEVTTPLADVRVLEDAASAKVNVWYFG
ncbi:MAG: hypothetical protein HYX38_35205 [Rhodospirillales bacterium]|nr:hypothetical protein [Rhodospirillales bacterium]